jgi:hypothetical protein
MGYEVNPQKVRVKTSDGLEIEGMINIRKEKRVSDHLMKDEPFVIVYEATSTASHKFCIRYWQYKISLLYYDIIQK